MAEHSDPTRKPAAAPASPARRGFFKAAATGAAGAALVGLSGGQAAATESTAEKVKSRYQETDHVKAFYETNRY
jgi:hypothetical protein